MGLRRLVCSRRRPRRDAQSIPRVDRRYRQGQISKLFLVEEISDVLKDRIRYMPNIA